jgi:hypothetical protein
MCWTVYIGTTERNVIEADQVYYTRQTREKIGNGWTNKSTLYIIKAGLWLVQEWCFIQEPCFLFYTHRTIQAKSDSFKSNQHKHVICFLCRMVCKRALLHVSTDFDLPYVPLGNFKEAMKDWNWVQHISSRYVLMICLYWR